MTGSVFGLTGWLFAIWSSSYRTLASLEASFKNCVSYFLRRVAYLASISVLLFSHSEWSYWRDSLSFFT